MAARIGVDIFSMAGLILKKHYFHKDERQMPPHTNQHFY
jgi:hypothetical protein